MYRIVCSDGTVLYDQSQPDSTRLITEPECERGIDQNGTKLSFSMLPTHPAFNQIAGMKTYLSVEADNEEIYYGRVTEIHDEKTTGVKQVQCTSVMSFLDDFEMAPIPNGEQTMTAEDFFRRCISSYNEELQKSSAFTSERALSVGTISHSKSAIRREFGLNGYQKVKAALDTYIIKEFGGYIRIRKNGNTHVIDWLETYGTSNASPIQLANNVITHENAITANEFYTVIHPLGKDSASLPEITVNVDDDLVNEYGRIVKTVSFNNAKNEEELRSEVNDFKEKMAKGLGKTCTVKLIDVHFLDSSVSRLQLGAVYTNIAGFENEEMTVFSMSLHFDSPAEDTVVLKNHRELSAIKNGSATGKVSKIISKAFENIHKHITETADMLSIHADLIELHGISIRETAQEFERYSRATDSTVGEILGTGVLQNSDHITQVAGNFTSKYSGVSRTRLDELVQKGISPASAGFYELEAIEITEDMIGSGIEVFGSPNGALNGEALDTSELTVGQIVYRAKFTKDSTVEPGKTYFVKSLSVGTGTELRLSENGYEISVYENINDVKEGLLSVTGSALWTQRNSITGIVGEFQIEEDPDTHERRLVIVSGGGLNILRNNVEYGLYDDGNLTGGIIVDKINNSSAQTRINGSKIIIGDGQAQKVLTTAIDSIEDVVGEFQVDEDPTTGEKTIVLKSGGGMKIRQNTQEFGIFHGGNLTGGIIVDRINGQGGSGVLTRIRGEFVDIEADQVRIGSTSNVQAWMNSTGQDISTLQGLVADKATIYELNAAKARIDTIESDYINTTELNTFMSHVTAAGIGTLTTDYINLSGSLNGGTILCSSLSVNGNSFSNPLVSASVGGTDNDTLTLTYASGATVTFRKAASITAHLVGEWRGNEFTVYADNDPDVISIAEAVSPVTGTGSSVWASNNITQFSSNHTAYGLVTATRGTAPIIGFNIDASSEYAAGEAEGWDTGYDAARGYVTMPSSGTGTTFTVGIPNEARTGSENRTFTITKGTPSASGGYAAVQYNGSAVARISISDWWTGGANSVTLSAGGWQNGANRVTASNGKYADVTLPSFSTSVGSFTDHKATVSFTTPSVTGPVKQAVVDATSEYNSGWSGSYAAVTLSATGTKSLTYGESITIYPKGKSTPSATAANITSISYKITAPADRYQTGYNAGHLDGVASVTITNVEQQGSITYSNGNYSVPVKATASNSETGSGTITFAGTSAYNAGWTGSYNAVTLSATGTKNLTYGESVTIYPKAKSSSGASAANITSISYKVTAPADRYQTGYNAGYNQGNLDGVDSVTISTVEQQGAITYSSGNYSVPVKATASNSKTGSGTITFAGTSAYNAGWNACLAACGLPNGGAVRTGGTYYANLYIMGQSGPSRVGSGYVGVNSVNVSTK